MRVPLIVVFAKMLSGFIYFFHISDFLLPSHLLLSKLNLLVEKRKYHILVAGT